MEELLPRQKYSFTSKYIMSTVNVLKTENGLLAKF